MKRSSLVALCLAAALVAPAPASAETLDNNSVITLTSAGLGDEAIVAKIKASTSNFELSTDQLLALRAKGVSSRVIAAMIEASNPKAAAPQSSTTSPDPMIPHPAGVYLFADQGEAARMVRIDATVTNQAKTGGIFGYALTGGIASMSIKAAIQNDTARVQTAMTTPVFYFFFDESNQSTQGTVATWASGTAATVTTPNEFTLIELIKKKGRREARVGSMNIGGAKTGVMDKDRLAFTYELVRPGVFKVTPSATLKPGEYGFIYSLAGGGANGALTARIFDFSIKG